MSSKPLNYRSTIDTREIVRIMQRSTTSPENIVWQSHSMGKNIIPIHNFEIDFVTREVVIFFDTKRYRMDRNLALYVKMDYHASVFKIEKYEINPSGLNFPFPTELKTLELRSQIRQAFPLLIEKFIYMKSANLNLPAHSTATELKVRAINISKQGLGLIVSEQNRSFLKNNRILWITKLQNTTLMDPLLCEVMYISEIDPKYSNRKQKDLKVGVKLSEEFPEYAFDTFIQ